MDTFETLGKILKPHAVLTSMGLTSERALEIVNNRNTSLKPMENETFTAPLRRYIAVIDKQANEIAATLLTRCTTLQLAEIIKQSGNNLFYSPDGGDIDLKLDAIRFNSVSNEIWELGFKNSINWEETYLLSDLGLDDKLSLIDIIENVLLNS